MKKGVLLMMIIMAMCMSLCMQANTKAAEKDADTGIVTGIIMLDGITYFDDIMPMNKEEYGKVTDNGVRLRRGHNVNSDVLELMYQGEKVKIIERLPGEKWYKVIRLKTGAEGYVSSKYIKLD